MHRLGLSEVADFLLSRVASKTGQIRLLILDLLVVRITDLMLVVLTDLRVALITSLRVDLLEVLVLDHRVVLITSLRVDLLEVLLDLLVVLITDLLLVVLIDLLVVIITDLLLVVLIDLLVVLITDLLLVVLIDLLVVLLIDLLVVFKTTKDLLLLRGSVQLLLRDFRVLAVGNTTNLLEVQCGGNHLHPVTEVLPSNKIPSQEMVA